MGSADLTDGVRDPVNVFAFTLFPTYAASSEHLLRIRNPPPRLVQYYPAPELASRAKRVVEQGTASLPYVYLLALRSLVEHAGVLYR